jgi:hypothetical protein
MIVAVLEVAIALLVGVFCYTQIVKPAFLGTKWFPLFRREGKLEKQIEEVKTKQQEKKVEARLREEKRDLNFTDKEKR